MTVKQSRSTAVQLYCTCTGTAVQAVQLYRYCQTAEKPRTSMAAQFTEQPGATEFPQSLASEDGALNNNHTEPSSDALGQKRKREEESDQCTLYVKGLPQDISLREIRNMFAFCEGFITVQLYAPNHSAQVMGAFVLMDCNKRALEVKTVLNGYSFQEGVHLSCELARKNLQKQSADGFSRPSPRAQMGGYPHSNMGSSGPPPQQQYYAPQPAYGQQAPPMYHQTQSAYPQQDGASPHRPAGTPSARIFVGGLSRDHTTEQSMSVFFQNFGIVTDCSIKRDAETGRSKGFGFVCFANQADAAALVDRPGLSLDGRDIACRFALQ